MPNVNAKPAKCAHCGRSVAAGQGRFIGPGVVVHNDVTCLRGSRAPWVEPRRPERGRITKAIGRAAKALFAP
jgi:hypothetical protein